MARGALSTRAPLGILDSAAGVLDIGRALFGSPAYSTLYKRTGEAIHLGLLRVGVCRRHGRTPSRDKTGRDEAIK